MKKIMCLILIMLTMVACKKEVDRLSGTYECITNIEAKLVGSKSPEFKGQLLFQQDISQDVNDKMLYVSTKSNMKFKKDLDEENDVLNDLISNILAQDPSSKFKLIKKDDNDLYINELSNDETETNKINFTENGYSINNSMNLILGIINLDTNCARKIIK